MLKLILILIVLVGCCSAEDRRINKSTLKIMTFNVEFMRDGTEAEEGRVGLAWKSSPDEAGEQMDEVAQVIRASNPDIIHFVETESKAAVHLFNQDYLAGYGYEVYFVKGKDTYILGDFNDYDSDAACLDHISSAPTTNVLANLKELESGTPDDDLFSIAEFISQAGRYTAFWDRDQDNKTDHPQEHTGIDHILVSESPRSQIQYAEILRGHNPVEVSDYCPVVVTIKTGSVP